jgi:membrane protein DedA with SNARE-associated domain
LSSREQRDGRCRRDALDEPRSRNRNSAGISFFAVRVIKNTRPSGFLFQGWPLNRYPQFIGRSEAFINRYGVTSVFLARFTAVVRAFVPLVAGILGMPPRQFYAANVLSALAWAPAHVFPGVLLAMAISLAGASAGQLTLLIIAGLVAVSAAVGATRFYLNRHPLPARLRLPDIAA